MKKIIEAKELPPEEQVYLKKDFLGWRVVEPIIIDGKFIWRNFISKKGLAMLLILLIVLASCYLAFKEQINNYREVMANPCSYCIDCQQQTKLMMQQYINSKLSSPNLSLIKVGDKVGEEMSM